MQRYCWPAAPIRIAAREVAREHDGQSCDGAHLGARGGREAVKSGGSVGCRAVRTTSGESIGSGLVSTGRTVVDRCTELFGAGRGLALAPAPRTAGGSIELRPYGPVPRTTLVRLPLREFLDVPNVVAFERPAGDRSRLGGVRMVTMSRASMAAPRRVSDASALA